MQWTTCTVASARADHLSTPPSIAALSERLGYVFDDVSLLERAMCHRSWCAENPGHEPNERLEFLGDAVLGLVVAEHVFAAYPDHDEGWLSRARSSVVRASALAEMAAELDLGSSMRLGKGEAASGGREKTSILADALEAVIGALYLDGGWPAASALVVGLIEGRVAELPGGRGDKDHKSVLQELATRDLQEKPVYEVTESGPEHAKTFVVRARLKGRSWGEGVGRSKKEAEQLAAQAALQLLRAELLLPSATHTGDDLSSFVLDLATAPNSSAPQPIPPTGEHTDA